VTAHWVVGAAKTIVEFYCKYAVAGHSIRLKDR
jgi:hypothetical protein